jgi:hypothetical protein
MEKEKQFEIIAIKYKLDYNVFELSWHSELKYVILALHYDRDWNSVKRYYAHFQIQYIDIQASLQ